MLSFNMQGTSGGVIQDVEFNLEWAKNEIETELADMVNPVIEGAQKLQERLVAYEIKQAEVIFTIKYLFINLITWINPYICKLTLKLTELL